MVNCQQIFIHKIGEDVLLLLIQEVVKIANIVEFLKNIYLQKKIELLNPRMYYKDLEIDGELYTSKY